MRSSSIHLLALLAPVLAQQPTDAGGGISELASHLGTNTALFASIVSTAQAQASASLVSVSKAAATATGAAGSSLSSELSSLQTQYSSRIEHHIFKHCGVYLVNLYLIFDILVFLDADFIDLFDVNNFGRRSFTSIEFLLIIINVSPDYEYIGCDCCHHSNCCFSSLSSLNTLNRIIRSRRIRLVRH
ncbi:hypothetical protein LTR91_022034 [Friedmanniomyces endolithicus]|uniref:Uncharacterized protein n=1 Tax=Friedmanniomyces endolithicus TaxID=329885 RepID=A0AAN6H9E0_9PEZI|nr:hypothetical protein LTR94_019383 [Friedmanniomyces endolithicus]KAK0774208.1 hypothetical protein LTR59_014988 [Friedmanniomyces endolithicus]KAK0775582.1 hypothetical protein LTR75_016534 [Friedmanniomyces endolithicus]KAK0776282.1 hypothetical protein LTR38_015569 [Friedmanniomyces endolithicus]KAK0831166.1 hypothetical protein LTR03_015669 [Friedmanniomyces endolithicus]